MNISIFGLGYVGCVSAGCLSKNGFNVIGVDVVEHKVNLLNQGKPTIIEKDIDTIIKESFDNGKLKATTNTEDAILNSDISIICVGTPIGDNGNLDLIYIYKVCEQIGKALKEKKSFHVVAIRSTVPPETSKKAAKIIEENSNKKQNIDFAMVSNPEFLREGTAVSDYYNPPYTILGSESKKALDIMESIYTNINAPVIKTDIKVAEIIKYVNNTYHALKIAFANEIGNICKGLDIDSHDVMDIFCKDTQLNISPYYFKPGFAYGGSCLPKDLNALANMSKNMNIETPVINNIKRSNEIQKDTALEQIIKFGKKKIGVLGLSFKAGTDDLRESPTVDLIERLIGKGYEVKIYDKNVQLSRLIGSNKSYIESKLPHLSSLLADINTVIDESEIIVVANKENDYKTIFECETKENCKLKEKIAYDLVRITKEMNFEGEYSGICW